MTNVTKLPFAKFHRGKIAAALLDAYKHPTKIEGRPRPASICDGACAMTTAPGLGDRIILTHVPRQAKEQDNTASIWPDYRYCELFDEFVPGWRPTNRTIFVDPQWMTYSYYCGPGHITQKVSRVLGLKPDAKPKGFLACPVTPFKDRIVLHFDPSPKHQAMQREQHHLHARELYPESRLILEQFIADNSDLEFVEVGQRPLRLRHTQWLQTDTLNDLVKTVATASWFIGVMSGPAHIAAALGLRSIILCNMPSAKRIVLPCLRPTGTVEEEWYYPQNVHLHQDDGTAMVPKFSRASLEAAFDGDVYPFWSDDWLELISAYDLAKYS